MSYVRVKDGWSGKIVFALRLLLLLLLLLLSLLRGVATPALSRTLAVGCSNSSGALWHTCTDN